MAAIWNPLIRETTVIFHSAERDAEAVAANVAARRDAGREVWVAEAVTERRGGELISVTELVPPNGAPFALDRSGITMTILAANGAVEVRGCPAP